MDKKEILGSISYKGNGEIYLGVVGAVRTGKSTFIKRFIENLVIPNIEDEITRKRCLDEIPQSASGKTIMTIEPKFVPSSGATIKIDDFETNIKLVDCVGYVINGSIGFEDNEGNPRMIKTPWYDEELPFDNEQLSMIISKIIIGKKYPYEGANKHNYETTIKIKLTINNELIDKFML